MIPLLRPSIQVVRESADSCAFIASEQQIFRCRGKTTPLLLDEILPLLDGRHAVERIAELMAGRLSPGAVATLVDMLSHHGVVIDAEADDAPGDERPGALADVHGFLAHHGRQPNRMLGELRRARAVVAGSAGALLPEVIDALARVGLGAIDVLSPDAPPPAERAAPTTRVVARDARSDEPVVERATIGITLAQSELDDPEGALSLSRACLRFGVPCLHVRLTREAEAWIGPLQISGGACLQCLRGRIRANLRGWRELDRAGEQRRAAREPAPETPLGGLFARQLGAMTAMEVLKHLTGLQPTELVGHCRIVDMISLDSSLQPVLRLPRCSVCTPSPDEPVRPWHADEVQLDRTLIGGEESHAPDAETA
jgi:bacteriocin biosynthesis cyclodehydratase domain-containing protein